MDEGNLSVFAPAVSLPPGDDASMAEQVGSPFAIPVLASMFDILPGGAVVSAFCPNAAPCVGADRHVLAIDSDPLSLLPLAVQMTGPEPDEVAAVFTQLLDATYRGRSWGQVLQDLYLTSCPACWRPARVIAYHWHGYPPVLDTRHVRCDNCSYDDETAVEPDDRVAAAETAPGRALSWEMMARVASPQHALREKVEHALGFYTPRTLWVLWQSLRILADLSLPVEQRRALQWVLTEALWRGSNVAGQPDLLWQATLRRPYRFVERNMWEVLHESLMYVQKRSGRLPRNLISRPDAAQEVEPGSVFLAQRWPEELPDYLEPDRVALALLAVPPPLPLYWLLRFVWSGWLFGGGAAAPLQPHLTLRPGGGEALEEMLSDVAETLSAWLEPDGKLMTQWRWRGEADHSAAVLASLPNFTGELRVAAAGEGEWVALAVSAASGSVESTKHKDLRKIGAATMRDVIRRRGEPVRGERLRPHILAAWRRLGDLPPPSVRQSHLDALLDPRTPSPGLVVWDREGEAWESGYAPWWWLEEPPSDWQIASVWRTASDQAELQALRLLATSSFPDADALVWQLALRLPPDLPPDRPWIDALVASYCLVTTKDGVALRPQDDPTQRRAELATLSAELVRIGQGLGFEVADWSEDDLKVVEWQQAGRRRACFLLTATTALTPRLWSSRTPLPGMQRFLVLPGGRASLVHWRIDHQPLWANAATAGGWIFVKFRHLREMLQTADDDPARWLAYLSLDPITAAHGEQMQLL